VVQYTAQSGVRSGPVTGLTYEAHHGEWLIVVGHDHVRVSDDVLYQVEATAEARRAVLHAAAEAQAQRNFESQFKTKRKDHGWTVRYHRERIADLRRQLAWHESKLAARPAHDTKTAPAL
jgi:hypothetical protein